MNVISKAGLLALAQEHPETLSYKTTKRANWNGLREVRATIRSADQVGSALIFDVLGNNYRLITKVDYPTNRLFAKALLTHREYDRKEWMKWA